MIVISSYSLLPQLLAATDVCLEAPASSLSMADSHRISTLVVDSQVAHASQEEAYVCLCYRQEKALDLASTGQATVLWLLEVENVQGRLCPHDSLWCLLLHRGSPALL